MSGIWKYVRNESILIEIRNRIMIKIWSIILKPTHNFMYLATYTVVSQVMLNSSIFTEYIATSLKLKLKL